MFHSVSPIQNKIWFSQHFLPSVAQNAEIEELPKLLLSQFTVRWHSKGAASVDFQAEDRLTPRWHVGQPCGKPRGKASWESVKGKPQIR